jgi:hypothetical protein
VRIGTLFAAGVLVALAFTLSSALVMRDGVGVFEYVIGIAAVVVLLLGALRISRRALPGA